jgi:CheY-like chemotaxis protein
LSQENHLIHWTAPLRVLIVEDIEERQKSLTSLYRSHAWILVNTGHRAIALLNAYNFDIISLDYNLRGELNGVDVAQALKCSRNKNARIIVHSLNPKGVEQISKILPNAIPYPLSKMVRSNQAFKRLRAKIDELGADYDWLCTKG